MPLGSLQLCSVCGVRQDHAFPSLFMIRITLVAWDLFLHINCRTCKSARHHFMPVRKTPLPQSPKCCQGCRGGGAWHMLVAMRISAPTWKQYESSSENSPRMHNMTTNYKPKGNEINLLRRHPYIYVYCNISHSSQKNRNSLSNQGQKSPLMEESMRLHVPLTQGCHLPSKPAWYPVLLNQYSVNTAPEWRTQFAWMTCLKQSIFCIHTTHLCSHNWL